MQHHFNAKITFDDFLVFYKTLSNISVLKDDKDLYIKL